MSQKVFVNRILNLKKIKFIGLDMDHTLIRYQTKNFEALVYQLLIETLIQEKNYPKDIRQFQFKFEDAIRGLVVDSKNGNVIKLSRYGAIRQSYHGTKRIKFSEQNQFYRSIYVDLNDDNYMAIDTSFSIAFCVLYAQLVDYKDNNPETLPSYHVMATDVLSSVDKIHAEGKLKQIICENPTQFILREKKLVEGLKRYLGYGKKIFILTNSEYAYTQNLLDYAINPFLESGQTWQDLFEYVMTGARKPRFFYDDNPFLSINPNDSCMTNLNGKIKPGIYQGGNAQKFTADLQLQGDEILYIGDHIYGDILRLKKDCNWRTALVVEELGEEIAAQIKAQPIEAKIISAMQAKTNLEEQYIHLSSKSIEAKTDQYNERIADLQKQVMAIDQELIRLIRQEHQFFNQKWDRIFRAGAQESYFAHQVELYACIYMEKLSDLFERSPLTYFRGHRRQLPHDSSSG